MTPQKSENETRDGVIAGLIAYTLWGMLRIYFKATADVSPVELLLHRVIWAVPFGALIIFLRRQCTSALLCTTAKS